MVVWTALAAGLLGGVADAGAQRVLHARDDYALLARDGVNLGGGTVVEGGHVGAISGSVLLGRNARVAGDVAAEKIELKRGATAANLVCRLIESDDATATCTSLGLPVAELPNLRLAQPPVGAIDVDIPKRTRSAPLGPGEYSDITVGVRAELLLEGGSYTFRSVFLDSRARLKCRSRCSIRIQETVFLRQRAAIVAPDTLDARAVRIDVEGGGKSFTARPLSNVAATVYAPKGVVYLGRRGQFVGAFVGLTVQTGTQAKVRELSTL
jgi:hypothetical protein